MDKDEKKLLITDLCARLPYAVKINCNGEIGPYTRPSTECTVMYGIAKVDNETDCWVVNGYDISQVKPYLRPMSSMTEEEREELRKEHIKDEQLFADCLINHPEMRGKVIPHFAAEWCNKNHFNYRLPEHLFITVTEANNPYKA